MEDTRSHLLISPGQLSSYPVSQDEADAVAR